MTHEEIVRGLVAAIHLRSMVRLLRRPDRIVDTVMAEALGVDPGEFTADLERARFWTRQITPELEFDPPFRVGPTLFSVRAYLDGDPNRPYQIRFAAENPAIIVGLAGLNRHIDVLIPLADLNRPGSVLTPIGSPTRLLRLIPALEVLGNGPDQSGDLSRGYP